MCSVAVSGRELCKSRFSPYENTLTLYQMLTENWFRDEEKVVAVWQLESQSVLRRPLSSWAHCAGQKSYLIVCDMFLCAVRPHHVRAETAALKQVSPEGRNPRNCRCQLLYELRRAANRTSCAALQAPSRVRGHAVSRGVCAETAALTRRSLSIRSRPGGRAPYRGTQRRSVRSFHRDSWRAISPCSLLFFVATLKQ